MQAPLIFDIKRASTTDGPGIRTVLFFKGCNLDCRWCHNPEGKSANAQIAYFKEKCISCGNCKAACESIRIPCKEACGKCVERCPSGARKLYGKAYSAKALFDIIAADRAYYTATGGGVTCSGGECLLQTDFLTQILAMCKKNGIHTAVDTAGHVPYEKFEQIMPYTDLFLYDVKCFDSEKHKQYTGVGNELILENLKKLLAASKPVWIRIPIIPTVNDTVEEMQRIKAFLDTCPPPQRIELLPYHAMGEYKYAALGWTVQSFDRPAPEVIEHLKAVFDPIKEQSQ